LLRSRSALRCRTLGRSRPRLAGLVPLMGKASVTNITVSLGFVVVPKALAMARLSVVASPLAILPLPPSRFRPLAPYCPLSWHLTATPLPGWHPTATHRLAPYWYSPAGTLLLRLRWVGPSSVTPSRGIALPPWLLSNALDRCNDLPDRTSWFWWALYWGFPMSPINNPLPWAAFLAVRVFSYVLVSLRKGLGLSTCTFLCNISLRV